MEVLFFIPAIYSFIYLYAYVKWLVKASGVKRKYTRLYNEPPRRGVEESARVYAHLYCNVLEYIDKVGKDCLRGFIVYASLGACVYIPILGMSWSIKWVAIYFISILIAGVCMHLYVKSKEEGTRQFYIDKFNEQKVLKEYHCESMSIWEQQSIKDTIEYCKRDIYRLKER